MCEGNAGHVNPPEGPNDAAEYHEEQQRIRNAPRTTNNIEEVDAWDVVPPMMSIGSNATEWKEVSACSEGSRIQYKQSLQHLGTFVVPDTFATTDSATSQPSSSALYPSPPTSISTTPLVLFDGEDVSYYLVAGCHDGTICLWNIMQLPALKAFVESRQPSVGAPISGKNSDEDAVANDEILSSNSPDPLHYINTLATIQPLQVIDTANSESHNRITASIVQIALCPQDYPSTAKSFAALNMLGTVYIVTFSEKAILNVSASFETGRLSPTCICYGIDSTIFIGYQSGFIEAWSFPKTSDTEGSGNSVPVEATQSDMDSTPRSSDGSFTLLWRATFVDCESAPPPAINAVASLSNVRRDAALSSKDIGSSMERTDSPCYLALTLHHNCSTRPSTSSMVEVVEATSIARSWTEFLNSNSNAASDEDAAVPLEDHCVLPEAGREILESTTIEFGDERRHRPTTNWIPSRATNRLCSVPPSDSATNQIAVGLADGMVAVLDCCKYDDGRTQWGVSPLIDQFCLPYPCIGMSCVNIADNHEGSTPYLACCMRGSATYMIPLQSFHDSDVATSTVLSISVPHGFDEDVSIRYVQEFSAFNLALKRIEEDISIPILVYVWPGGVIDVYSFGLLSCKHSLPDKQLIQELVANGSAGVLRDVLLDSSDDDAAMHNMWTDAVEEVRKLEREASIAIEDIYSERLASFRTVLLHFAQ